MSSSSRQFSRDEVLPHFWRLWEALIPSCQKCTWAGSMRRRKPYLSDLEMVVLPFFDTTRNLIDEEEVAVETYSQMTAVLDSLLASRVLVWDEEVKRRGDWYKRFRLRELGIGFDLFVARPNNYGYILALRTGSAEFSHSLVTPRHQGGLRPLDLRCKDGQIWRQEKDGNGLAVTVAVPVPTETTLFNLWEMPEVRPQEREAGIVADLRRGWGLAPVPAYAGGQRMEAGR